MQYFATQLRIGEKIGIGFGIVGLLFLLVTWQFQDTLERSLSDYRQLQNVQAATKDRILAIEVELLQARAAEKLFLMTRDQHHAQRVNEHITAARRESDHLSGIDDKSLKLSEEIDGYLQRYLAHFNNVETAWIRKGLDENSGLQGSFREAVHNLEAMAGNLNSDQLYLDLLQIRRGEKDLGLRREVQYQQRVFGLLGQFETDVKDSGLLPGVREEMLDEISAYRKEFALYAQRVLQGGDLRGGKGPFRDAAHRIEGLISQYHVPDLERDVLQLRRREKDYLLRGENQYVEMVFRQVTVIENRISSSSLGNEQQREFLSLLNRYREDFKSLVDQSEEVSRLTVQMEGAASHVIELVRKSVESANSEMAEVIKSTDAVSRERTDLMNWVVVFAIALGVLFSIYLTNHIVRPMRKMADLLEQLTYTELVDPVRHVEGGRDEINMMAGYLNTLVEHRNRFVDWWKSSMDESIACEQLKGLIENPARESSDMNNEIQSAKQDLIEALSGKKTLISREFEEMKDHAEEILNASAHLRHPSVSRGDVDEQGKRIHYSAEMMKKSLSMLSRDAA
ncbi:MAG: hypothetical protein ABW085_13460 [Sedimenticola sp.]